LALIFCREARRNLRIGYFFRIGLNQPFYYINHAILFILFPLFSAQLPVDLDISPVLADFFLQAVLRRANRRAEDGGDARTYCEGEGTARPGASGGTAAADGERRGVEDVTESGE
jgi:hypothetical protein